MNTATEYEREILDVMASIRHGCSLDEAGLLLQKNSKRHMRSGNEMARLFRDLPEAIANTGALSDRLSFVMKDMGHEFPRYPIPEGETMGSFLRKRTFEGVACRCGCKAAPSCGPKPTSRLKRSSRSLQSSDLRGTSSSCGTLLSSAASAAS